MAYKSVYELILSMYPRRTIRSKKRRIKKKYRHRDYMRKLCKAIEKGARDNGKHVI